MREHLETAAASPRPSKARTAARERLEGPEVPESLAYLRGILYQVHGRSGAGMGGALPLSNVELTAWAEGRGIALEPGEIDALMMLDGVLISEREKARPKPAETPQRRRG